MWDRSLSGASSFASSVSSVERSRQPGEGKGNSQLSSAPRRGRRRLDLEQGLSGVLPSYTGLSSAFRKEFDHPNSMKLHVQCIHIRGAGPHLNLQKPSYLFHILNKYALNIFATPGTEHHAGNTVVPKTGTTPALRQLLLVQWSQR